MIKKVGKAAESRVTAQKGGQAVTTKERGVRIAKTRREEHKKGGESTGSEAAMAQIGSEDSLNSKDKREVRDDLDRHGI